MYHFKGIKEEYNPKSIIREVGNFVIRNPGFFYVLSRTICIAGIIPTESEKDYLEKASKILDHLIMDSLEIKTIDLSQKDDFIKLMHQFFVEDFNASGNLRGKLLEYLIGNIGPITVCIEKPNYLRKCYVVDEDEKRIGGEKNFDAAYFSDYSSINDLVAELLESKCNLEKFLIGNNRELRHLANDKCIYMETIRITLKDSKELIVAFVTLLENIDKCRRLLDCAGFGDISIINYGRLKKVLYKKAS